MEIKFVGNRKCNKLCPMCPIPGASGCYDAHDGPKAINQIGGFLKNQDPGLRSVVRPK